ncbi:MATE family efflux transporter [Treponema rectale]|uniref:Multidrug-efflux transporter n=1 Tax=Treponema rectale TaxID=744512 RepID=A0A840SHD4_9SPIR|nr:MATE family efflux transporter [Treponema rectale]MBB5219316.1 putative MATE family efflux protein [Treponema rectale]QOS41266.1 MATE family efflux transporter [Treponema rectale]
MKTYDMTEGNPFRLIIFYSLPMLIGQVFQQLYSMCDTVIVGRLLGSSALGAVGNTGPMNFLVLGFLFGMTSGFAVITAQRFGAKDEAGLKKSVAQNILLNAASAVVITILACAFTKPILRAIHTPEGSFFNDSFNYIFIIYAGIPALVLYNGCACVLRAVGDSKTPLYFLIVSSFLNIVLDIVFIKYCGMGVGGAAFATVISQGISGVLSLLWIIIKFPSLHVKLSDFNGGRQFMMRHLTIGLSMGFQFSITAIGVVVLQGALNLFGEVKISAYTAAQKVEQLVTVAAGVIGTTMTTYAGQNLGAGRIDRIREGVTKSTIISVSFAVLAAVLALLLSDQMTAIFIDRNEAGMTAEKWAEILKSSATYLKICGLNFPVLFVLFIYRNTLQGVNRGFWPLMGGVFELVARTVAAYTLPSVLGYAGICAAGPIAWAAAAIPLAFACYIQLYSKKHPLV